jgi:glycosyltransferase involved in cell wall biosynthesis
MRIALYGDELLTWQGGRDLFRILFESLNLGCAAEDEIIVITRASRDSLPWRVARIGKYLLTHFPYDFRWIIHELRRVSREKLINDVIGERARLFVVRGKLLSRKAFQALPEFDVAGPFMSPPTWLGNGAWIGYLFDCQHKRFPNFFSPQECVARDHQFATLLRAAPVVIVHSLEAKADLKAYFGAMEAEIVPLPFAASANPLWLQLDATRAREKYRLPKEYFLCSNQFWQHKNHLVIFEALSIARAHGVRMSVAFTGEMQDYRNPAYVKDLIARVEALGISKDCHFLGLIPKIDQIGIMRSAIAIIQPTLFEGAPGGLSVSEAIGVGQRVIASDIPVNREIEQYVDEYFPPTDAKALFYAMCRVREQVNSEPVQQQLLTEGLERRRHFGRVLRSAFAKAVENSKESPLRVIGSKRVSSQTLD